MFPDEMLRYDPFTIREPLMNAIAHQDYNAGGRINLVEFEDDRLVFSNLGSFIPKSVEEVVLSDTPEEKYRNPFLVEAMKNLDMIETQGGGIRKIFNQQAIRFFPLPDYEISHNKVKVSIQGKIVNKDFAEILIRNPKLTLADIILLDKVQKRKAITSMEAEYLRGKTLIEGRKPNYFLSKVAVESISDVQLNADYIRNKSFDDQHFKDMIISYLEKFTKAKRKAFESLLLPKLSDALTEKQKKKKIPNLLSALSREGKIKAIEGYWWVINKNEISD